MKHDITLKVNGRSHNLTVESQRTLLEVLRDHLSLFGAREACGMSICGACTVLVDEVAVSSCSYFAARAHGREITTVEGLADGQQLHPVQQAFLECGGFQCSFCTPGMILSTVCLLRENPNPTVDEAKEYLVGNLCRCASYPDILNSVMAAAEKVRIQHA